MQEYDKALRQICQRLAQESQTNRQMPPAARWLLDNYGFLRTQARELREALSPKFWRKLALAEKADPDSQHNPRICRLITEMVERTSGKIEFEYLIEYFENFQNTTAVLSLAELWAVHPVLKLVLLESILKVGRPLAERGWQAKAPAPQAEEERIANAITSIRAIDQMSLKDFVEAVSGVEKTLRQDPTGVYGRMDFDSRDLYRRAVEEIAERSWCSEPEVAQMAIRMAKEAKTAGGDVRKAHVGYYLIGPGCRALRRSSGHGVTIREAIRDTLLKYPNVFYIGTVIVLMAALLWLTAALLLPPWWILLLLLIPVSQVAIQILNSVVGLALPPRRLPRLDLSGGVPDDSRTFVVVPTLLLSRSNVEELLERIEIHYLANRDGNLLFGLLTDFRDAPSEHTDNDDLAEVCAKGIRGLNDRYRANGRAPFYLFHRPRLWNASEGAWMGHERKRGKLEDFNQFLLGRADAFSLKVGDLDAIQDIRYVITLDTDTHLPRDSARELIATLYHHLNRAVFNDKDTVTEGYGLLQPRISVSMESAQRSRLARIYSGQTGLDPYTKAVSDVYQDLHGQATYTGKGIYDLAAFDRATRDRFPDNTLLSHDLIEGEHVRVGLVTDIELVDDFPTSYQAYSKRKHRWVRGDWQIAEWLLPTVPDGTGKKVKNPLGLLSRWKILDNLRRSLFEIALTAFFLVGMFSTGLAFRYSIAMLAILIPGAAVQMIISLLHFPPRRFWRAFLREVGWNFLQGLLEASLTIAFALHQALLMADAIVRTLVRRHYSRRKLLEWETMAQAAAGGNQLDIVNIYALLCPVIATVIAFFAALAHTGYELLPITILILWAGTPLLAEFVSSRMRLEADHNAKDTRFLRELSLQTWHYFVDYGGPDENWLVPDNVQFDPQAIATRASPTNIGLQLSANLAAFDFGYLTQKEVAAGFGRIFETLDRMERSRGHFYNWYDTRTLEPLHPLFISTVDSGNLAASLITIKQGCLDILNGPLLARSARLGLMDYCGRLRQTLPHGSRTAQIMREINSLCKQLEYQPSELFAWAGLLTELDRMGRPLAEHMSWLCEHARQKKGDSCEEARYWIDAFNGRVKALREMLGELAPWVAGTLGLELRLSASDHRLDTLMALLNRMPKLSEWKAHHEAIAREVEQQRQAQGMVAATRRTLDDLAEALGEARNRGTELCEAFTHISEHANQFFAEMDFRFLLDKRRNLLHIGFQVEAQKLEPSHYDLLASEARTAVFIAVAKGDIPRESWFRLGRKLTTFGGYRTLLSWSGTMFEYLMPHLFLRNFENSLLAESAAGAVRIQETYCRTRRVPWGISEAAYSARDANLNYQYKAFGIPALGLSRIQPDDLVVAPYACALALMVDPRRATTNLRHMAERGWMGPYGFYESIDYATGRPVVVRAYMVHHQGMALLALANTLLGNSIQSRFHAEAAVLATELLLQERLPALVAETEAEEALPVEAEPARSMVEVGQES